LTAAETSLPLRGVEDDDARGLFALAHRHLGHPPAIAGWQWLGRQPGPQADSLDHVGRGLESVLPRRIPLLAASSSIWTCRTTWLCSELKSYITFDASRPNGALADYLLTVPVNAKGRVQGLELAYQQAVGENFGFSATTRMRTAKQTSRLTITGDDRLVRHVEEHLQPERVLWRMHASTRRVTYTYRSAFFSGLDRNTAFSQDAHRGHSRIARLHAE